MITLIMAARIAAGGWADRSGSGITPLASSPLFGTAGLAVQSCPLSSEVYLYSRYLPMNYGSWSGGAPDFPS